MVNETVLIALTLVAALGLLGMVVIDIDVSQQEVEAKSIVGQCASGFKNATSQLCHNFR